LLLTLKLLNYQVFFSGKNYNST